MLELVGITVIVGILAALSAPSVLGLIDRQRLNAARADALQAMQQAQTNAKKQQVVWQASFRDTGDGVEWAVHPAHVTPTAWNSLGNNGEKFTILDSPTTYTTLRSAGSATYRVRFRPPNGQVVITPPSQTGLGKITFALRSNIARSPKRCVIVSTILGSLRIDGEDSPSDRKCHF